MCNWDMYSRLQFEPSLVLESKQKKMVAVLEQQDVRYKIFRMTRQNEGGGFLEQRDNRYSMILRMARISSTGIIQYSFP